MKDECKQEKMRTREKQKVITKREEWEKNQYIEREGERVAPNIPHHFTKFTGSHLPSRTFYIVN